MFEDTYTYNEDADIYQTSPMFEEYYRNIKYWSVEKPFLDKFPELAEDITVCCSHTSPVPGMGNMRGVAATDIGLTESFTDNEILDLFGEDPPDT